MYSPIRLHSSYWHSRSNFRGAHHSWSQQSKIHVLTSQYHQKWWDSLVNRFLISKLLRLFIFRLVSVFYSLAMISMGGGALKAHSSLIHIHFWVQYGSNKECQCRLSSFEIPISAWPMSPQGKFNLENHRACVGSPTSGQQGNKFQSGKVTTRHCTKGQKTARGKGPRYWQPVTKEEDVIFFMAVSYPELNKPHWMDGWWGTAILVICHILFCKSMVKRCRSPTISSWVVEGSLFNKDPEICVIEMIDIHKRTSNDGDIAVVKAHERRRGQPVPQGIERWTISGWSQWGYSAASKGKECFSQPKMSVTRSAS